MVCDEEEICRALEAVRVDGMAVLDTVDETVGSTVAVIGRRARLSD